MTKKQEVIRGWVARDKEGVSSGYGMFTRFEPRMQKTGLWFMPGDYWGCSKSLGLKPGECKMASITVVVDE